MTYQSWSSGEGCVFKVSTADAPSLTLLHVDVRKLSFGVLDPCLAGQGGEVLISV